ncbi:unnamed protein product [Fraxinus pennsylvanica]|uniref:Uncharacterized protein n=1 Tax=Fraxinus pennsylvanica TaxID=56036 RepID=A0AAD2EAM4_9LAMI|nr:unnamed protein product [Fraxinus pennsylvanica]
MMKSTRICWNIMSHTTQASLQLNYSLVLHYQYLRNTVCSVAARLQLFGCYMLYGVAGFSQISWMEMLYKTCSGKNVGGAGYVEKRNSAFSSLVMWALLTVECEKCSSDSSG